MRLLAGLVMLAPLTATGADAPIERCVAIDDNEARLACYDTAAGRADYLERRPAPAVAGPTAQLPAPPARPAAPPPAPRPVEQPVASTASVSTAPERERAAPQPADDFGLEQERNDEKYIRSRLDGEFTGWSGRTLFKLENGQVWRQSEPGRFRAQIDRPLITIERGVFNSYRLKVEGMNRSIRVKRIR